MARVSRPATANKIVTYTYIHMIICVHEQSYYIVHYIGRKEEGKEGRKNQTNTNNLQQPQGLRKIYVCTHVHAHLFYKLCQ